MATLRGRHLKPMESVSRGGHRGGLVAGTAEDAAGDGLGEVDALAEERTIRS
jgi:hypothetical protein